MTSEAPGPTEILPPGDDAPLPGLHAIRGRHVAPGTKIGRFIVVELVAEGGMGALYKAYDPELDRAVAVKLVRPTGTEAVSPASQERLLREARALARLSHPNVVTVYEAGPFGDEVFVAMEFVQGSTLRRWLRTAARSRKDILAAFRAAGEGLAAAHRAGLVHRDFKPDNVLVGDDGRVRVVDFGLARTTVPGEPADLATSGFGPALPAIAPTGAPFVASAEGAPSSDGGRSGSGASGGLTQHGSLLGTPRYMAPEQHLGFAATAKSDQFAFAVALYEALYGRHPFAAKGRDDFLQKVTAGRIDAAPRETTVPRWLRAVLLRALALRTDDRFGTQEALLAALAKDPTATRLRALAFVGITLLAITSVLGGLHFLRQRAHGCDGAERALAGLWDDARRAETHAAFARSGLVYFDEAFQRVSLALDGYTKEWVRTSTSVCQVRAAAPARGAEMEAANRCLVERLVELRALVDVLGRGDAGIVGAALSSALALPAPGACEDPARLAATPPPPTDPGVRATVVALAKRRAEASALADVGRLKEAEEALEALLPDAERAAHAPFLAETLFDLGRVYEYGNEYERSRAMLHRCIKVADEARADAVRASAHIHLVRSAYGQQQYGEAFEQADLALAVVKRIGDDGLLARLLMQRAWARLFAQDARTALADARQGLEVARRVYGENAPLTAELHSVLGSVAADLEDQVEAERESRRALLIVEKLYADHEERTARMAENLALVLGYQGKLEEATRLQRRAVAIATELWGHDDTNTAIKLQNLGSFLVDQREDDEALQILEHARSVLAKDPAERSSEWMASTLTSLGTAELHQGSLARASATLEEAVSLVRAGTFDPQVEAESRFSLAHALVAQNRDRARARALAHEGLAELRKVPRLRALGTEIKAWLVALEAP